MKMTDVITRFRYLNPGIQMNAKRLDGKIGEVVSLVRDADRCTTEEGRKALVSALMIAALEMKVVYGDVMKSLAEMDEAINSYTRKFESSAAEETAADPDAPKQGEFDFTGSGADDPTEGDGSTVVQAEGL